MEKRASALGNKSTGERHKLTIKVGSGGSSNNDFVLHENPLLVVGFLLLGGLLGGVGWIYGIWLLWRDSGLTKFQKLLGTFVFPGGILPAFVFASIATGTSICTTGLVSPTHVGPVVAHCNSSGGSNPVAVFSVEAILLLFPVLVAIYLYKTLVATHDS